MRVALYGRVSTRDKQDVENQLVQLREFCQRSGWQVVQEFFDKESGKTANRPRFTAMFDAARRHDFDLVLFWSLDRLSREGVLQTLQHLQALDAAGVGWKSYSEQYLDSTGVFKDAVISILATVAKQERIRLVERIQAGLRQARARRKVDKTLPPFGRPRLVVDRARVQEMQDRGLSVRVIAERLKVSKSTIGRLRGSA